MGDGGGKCGVGKWGWGREIWGWEKCGVSLYYTTDIFTVQARESLFIPFY